MEVRKPNIKNLFVGQEFKSFRELVEFVEMPYRTGGSDKIVMEHKLRKYFNWENKINEKTGRKRQALVITEIYEVQ